MLQLQVRSIFQQDQFLLVNGLEVHSGGSVIFYITKLHQVGGNSLCVCVCGLYL